MEVVVKEDMEVAVVVAIVKVTRTLIHKQFCQCFSNKRKDMEVVTVQVMEVVTDQVMAQVVDRTT